MSLLSIVSNAMLRQGQSAPASVIGSTDTGVIQRLALLQDIGDELAERVSWQAENIAGSITCNGTSTLFSLPVDWGGMSAGETLQSTLYPTMPVIGPITNEAMAAFKALPVTPIQPVWRIIQGQFEFYPAPASGEVYKYNYYSKYWIKAAGGGTSAVWANDTDTSLIDEKVLTSGLEWRWLKSKGLDYAEEFRRFEMRIARAEGRDDDSREVAMSNKRISGTNTWPGQFPIYDGSANEGSDTAFI